MAGAGCGGMEKVNCASRKANFAAGIAAGAYCVKGPGKVPLALRSLSQHGCKHKRTRVKGEEPATGLCCAPLARVLLPNGHWYCDRVKHKVSLPRLWGGSMVLLQCVTHSLVIERPLAVREKPGAGSACPCRAMQGLVPSPAHIWVTVLNWTIVFGRAYLLLGR